MRNKIKGALTDRLKEIQGKTVSVASVNRGSFNSHTLHLSFTDDSQVDLPYTLDYKDDFLADDFEINDVRGDYDGTPMPFKVPKGLIQPWRYYVVAIKFNANNPAHRAIMATSGHRNSKGDWMLSERFQLFSMGYENNDQQYSLYDIYWFRVVEEITELRRSV